MACSMEKELIFTSGFASPSAELHSVCSSVASKYTPPPAVTLARKISQSAQSLDLAALATSETDASRLFAKSNSTAELQSKEKQDGESRTEAGTGEMIEVGNKERITRMREKWLMAARKIVITQNLAKTERSKTISEGKLELFLFTYVTFRDMNV